MKLLLGFNAPPKKTKTGRLLNMMGENSYILTIC